VITEEVLSQIFERDVSIWEFCEELEKRSFVFARNLSIESIQNKLKEARAGRRSESEASTSTSTSRTVNEVLLLSAYLDSQRGD